MNFYFGFSQALNNQIGLTPNSTSTCRNAVWSSGMIMAVKAVFARSHRCTIGRESD